MIGEELRAALKNQDYGSGVFAKLDAIDRAYKALSGINHDFMPGYNKLDHVKQGSAFPSSAPTGLLFWRSDLGLLCEYDGTQWLTAYEYVTGGIYTLFSATGTGSCVNPGNTYQPYYTRIQLYTYVATTNDGSNYWDVDIIGRNLSYTNTTIYGVDTSADSADALTDHDGAPTTALPTNHVLLETSVTKNGSPGNIGVYASAYYKLVIT